MNQFWGTILFIYGYITNLVSIVPNYLHCKELKTKCNNIRCMSSSCCKPIMKDYKTTKPKCNKLSF